VALAAMAAATAELNAQKVNVLVPPQAWSWLQVCVLCSMLYVGDVSFNSLGL
jgi:hypothetical protein